MAQEHPNARLVREATEAVNQGDPEKFLGMLADDVKWHEVGADEPVAGKQAVVESLMGAADADFEITADLHDVLANDDHTIALVDARATRNGKTLDYRTVEILHVKDGKVTERWSFADDTQKVLDFFA